MDVHFLVNKILVKVIENSLFKCLTHQFRECGANAQQLLFRSMAC